MHFVPMVMNRIEKFDAIYPRQAQVQEDDIGQGTIGHGQRFIATGCHAANLEMRLTRQDFLQHRANGKGIIDYEYLERFHIFAIADRTHAIVAEYG